MQQPPPTYTVNGAQIRALRKSLGLLTADLAAKAGISRGYLSALEIGLRRDMRPPTYVALRTALGLSPNDTRLLAPNEQPPREEVT